MIYQKYLALLCCFQLTYFTTTSVGSAVGSIILCWTRAIVYCTTKHALSKQTVEGELFILLPLSEKKWEVHYMHGNVCAYFNTSMRESACCFMIGLGPSLLFQGQKPNVIRTSCKRHVLFRYVTLHACESSLEALRHTNKQESQSAQREALTLKQLDADSSVTTRQ